MISKSVRIRLCNQFGHLWGLGLRKVAGRLEEFEACKCCLRCHSTAEL